MGDKQLSPPLKEAADQVAAALHQWGLQLPALLALQAGRPLTFLGAQCLYVAQPALSLWLSPQSIHTLAHLLESSDGVNQLIARLETAH